MTVKTLTQAQKILNKIPDINFGGCGVAALALYRWAKQNGYDPDGFALLYREYDKDMMQENESAIQSNRLSDLDVPSHVALQVDGHLYDSAGNDANNTCQTTLTQPGISESVMLHLLNDLCHWNYCFDRATQVPIIAESLGIDLSDVTLTS